MSDVTRMVCVDFETGRITAWGKVTGGQAHRFGVLGPYDTGAMREFPFDLAQLEQFRTGPGEFMSGRPAPAGADTGPLAA